MEGAEAGGALRFLPTDSELFEMEAEGLWDIVAGEKRTGVDIIDKKQDEQRRAQGPNIPGRGFEHQARVTPSLDPSASFSCPLYSSASNSASMALLLDAVARSSPFPLAPSGDISTRAARRCSK